MGKVIEHQKSIILNKKRSVNKVIYSVLAIISIFYFVKTIDFISGIDIVNYLNYATLSLKHLINNINNGLLQVIINEPIFLLINIVLNMIFSAEGVIIFIVIISVSLYYYSFGKLNNWNIYMIISTILLSQINVNFTTHIRQGLALSIYLFSFTKENKYKRFVLKLLACFTHTSLLFLFLFEIIEVILNWLKIRSFKIYKNIIISFILTMILVSIPLIATIIGDRRGQSYSLFFNISIGGGWIFWFLFGILYLKYNKTQKFYKLNVYGIIFYLVGYLIFQASARVFENIIPFIICDICNNKNKNYKYISMLLLLCFAILTL